MPADGQYAQYYSQAINKDAPHPAAARLWQEYLYSAEGQNLWLKGYARPALMPAMEKAGTLDKAAAAKLPEVSGTPTFPTEAQQSKAKTVLAQGWAQGRLRMTAATRRRRGRRGARRRRPQRRRRRRAPAGSPSLPLLVFVAIAFGLPGLAMLNGAFTVKDPATGATSYTTANLTDVAAGRLPHRAARQRQAVRRLRGHRAPSSGCCSRRPW